MKCGVQDLKAAPYPDKNHNIWALLSNVLVALDVPMDFASEPNISNQYGCKHVEISRNLDSSTLR